ncbi:MAG: hypothetical protein CTY38_00720 [Methylotenera sp.]|uniref:hypothetical protein n=1 Tax=Methylotenera sp. TaxID=2051956 RepID=UPI000D491D27|nr:hypothetical protein [Methylotenera sp.]PPC84601.1 MAG: hypothetical protein CTY38_00720 [Methylotenera sp.]
MEVKELKPMSPAEIRAEIKRRGWSTDLIATRWGMTRRRVQQLVADEDRPRYYDDAVNGLPQLVS